MGSNETVELRAIVSAMATLTERLDGVNIGVQPITKPMAAAQLEALSARLRWIADEWRARDGAYFASKPLAQLTAVELSAFRRYASDNEDWRTCDEIDEFTRERRVARHGAAPCYA